MEDYIDECEFIDDELDIAACGGLLLADTH